MFEGIKHHFSDGSLTSASYVDGDVMGSVSFYSAENCTRVLSCIGPHDAMLECSFSHRVRKFSNRCRARTNETVEDYSRLA